MSNAALVVALDLYAIGAIITWLRGVRHLPEPSRLADVATDLVVITLWPVAWTIACIRAVVILIVTEESDS